MILFRKLAKPRFVMVYPLAVWLFLTAHTTPRSFAIGAAIVLAGELVRIWANGVVGHMKVNRTDPAQGQPKIGHLITSGPYAFIRHPLYFGSLLIGLGMLVIAGNLWIGLLAPAVFFLIYRSKMAEEEETLAHEWPAEYAAYRRAVPRWWPTSHAARAAAAMVLWAAVPTRKEEGNTGSAPCRSAKAKAWAGSPAACHKSCNTSLGVMDMFLSTRWLGLSKSLWVGMRPPVCALL